MGCSRCQGTLEIKIKTNDIPICCHGFGKKGNLCLTTLTILAMCLTDVVGQWVLKVRPALVLQMCMRCGRIVYNVCMLYPHTKTWEEPPLPK